MLGGSGDTVATQWRQWQQQGWNGDGESAATGKVEVQVLLVGDSNAVATMSAARLEWRWLNGGGRQGGGDRDGGGAGFDWWWRQ